MEPLALPTIRMRPVPGVAQACRIVPVPGGGDVILEGPADTLSAIRLARISSRPPSFAVLPDVDEQATGAMLDWLRVLLQSRHGAGHPPGPVPRT